MRNPHASSDQPSDYLPAAEAARLLDVKLPTLYAYASRGKVRSVPADSGQGRRYLRADLERLKARHHARSGHGPVAAGALDWGEPVLESSITEITPGGPRYRGRPALELAAQGIGFERVAELLWSGTLPDVSRWSPEPPHALPRAVRAIVPAGSSAPSVLAAVTAALALRDLDRFGAAPEAEWARARKLIRVLAASLSLAREPRDVDSALSQATIATTLAVALGVKTARANLALIEQALVLSADHELNPSAFTARVAASSGADLYACIGAGLATYSGPRHGGSVERVEALLAEIGSPERVLPVIRDRLRRGESLPSFGHTLYPQGDPRAAPLLSAALAHAPRSAPVRTVLALTQALAPLRHHASLDVGIVAIGRALGLGPGGAISLFAIGRMAGWVAHALEQRAKGRLVRPRARFA